MNYQSFLHPSYILVSTIVNRFILQNMFHNSKSTSLLSVNAMFASFILRYTKES